MLFDLSRSLEPLHELLRGRGGCHLTTNPPKSGEPLPELLVSSSEDVGGVI